MKPEMACRDGVAVLAEYLDAVLPAPERARVDAHLRDCARCTAFVESYLATSRVFRAVTEVPMPASARESLRRFLARRRD